MKKLVLISILFAVSLPAFASTPLQDLKKKQEELAIIELSDRISKTYVVDATRTVKHFWFETNTFISKFKPSPWNCENIVIITYYSTLTKEFGSTARTGECVKLIINFDSDIVWQSQTIFDLNEFIQEKRRQSLEDFKKYIVQ